MLTAEELKKKNPHVPPQAIDRAMSWVSNARVKDKSHISIVDFSKSDAEKRYHLINTETGECEDHKVAHGRNSDQNKDNVPDHFSNVEGSYQSSLGAMTIDNEVKSNHYKVVHLMTGLEPGRNDHVRARAILWHSASYVDDGTKAPSGDTLGCFGMATETAKKLNKIVTNTLLYAWHPSLETNVEAPTKSIAGPSYSEGSMGDVVSQIQRIVGATRDGVWGPKTTAAVKLWQKKMALTPDGIAGPKTLAAMGLTDVPAEPKPEQPAPGNPALGLGPNPYKRGSVLWYEFLYKGIQFDKGYEKQIQTNSKILLGQKTRAFPMEQKTRVPWALIGALNIMEGGGGFDKYLGNGQSIHQRTTIVPIGRGPFATWEDGVLDALKIDGLSNVLDWSLGLMLKYAEQFNGLGYMQYHHDSDTPKIWPMTSESPYLWACSNINDGTGKYTSDGHYDPNADANKQVGVATMLKQLEIWGEFKPVFATT